MSKEKHIEEMACTMCGNKNICVGEGVEKCILYPQMRRYADRAYREGYRKQSEGEWIYMDGDVGYDVCNCSVCGESVTFYDDERYAFCPNCGAKMKGV